MSKLKMPAINYVSLAGRLVTDPELHLGDNGVKRLRVRLAVNRSYRDRSDQWQEETSFFDLVLWQKQVDYYAEQLAKGIPVLANGRLHSSSWKDDQERHHTRIEGLCPQSADPRKDYRGRPCRASPRGSLTLGAVPRGTALSHSAQTKPRSPCRRRYKGRPPPNATGAVPFRQARSHKCAPRWRRPDAPRRWRRH